MNVCDKWGMYPGGFDGPGYRKVMCFGRSWDPKAPPVPYQLISLVATAVEDARAHLDELPSMCPDTCLVTFYRRGAFDDELNQVSFNMHIHALAHTHIEGVNLTQSL